MVNHPTDGSFFRHDNRAACEMQQTRGYPNGPGALCAQPLAALKEQSRSISSNCRAAIICVKAAACHRAVTTPVSRSSDSNSSGAATTEDLMSDVDHVLHAYVKALAISSSLLAPLIYDLTTDLLLLYAKQLDGVQRLSTEEHKMVSKVSKLLETLVATFQGPVAELDIKAECLCIQGEEHLE